MAEAIKADASARKSWAEFLASSPPDSTEEVEGLFIAHPGVADRWISLTPDVRVYCVSEECQGYRFFECKTSSFHVGGSTWSFEFVHYSCRNCRRNRKTFSVAVMPTSGGRGQALKLGEDPPFGPHTPSRVISLIGPDRDLFLQGRRAENRGLGIGAFSYYRRVVESQKGRIIQEIKKVAERLGARSEILKALEAAKAETQFSKAVDDIRAAIPDIQLIDGQNPLTLLHKALSKGIHAKTDAECLSLAQDIRIVLTELAERAGQALTDQAELAQAVNRLASLQPEPPEDSVGDPAKTYPGSTELSPEQASARSQKTIELVEAVPGPGQGRR